MKYLNVLLKSYFIFQITLMGDKLDNNTKNNLNDNNVSDDLNFKKSFFSQKKKIHKNVKRMLCRNVIKGGECSYGSKCMYAHTLEEQIIDFPKKHAWAIILSNDSLETIDLQKNYQLYQSLEQLTKVCKQCFNKECIGGYNCDHGVFDKKYQICQRDLDWGDCKNPLCEMIHLTKRGLKPWFNKQKNINVSSPHQKIKGTLLSENFFVGMTGVTSSQHGQYDKDDETLSNFTDSSDEIDTFDDECDKSIFSL